MKNAIILAAVVLCSACSVTPTYWAKAERVCETFGGVKTVAAHKNTIECLDGTLIYPR